MRARQWPGEDADRTKSLPVPQNARRLHWTLLEERDPVHVIDRAGHPEWAVSYELANRRGLYLLRRIRRPGEPAEVVWETTPVIKSIAVGWWLDVLAGRAT
jgi:hypothetical protein